MPPHYNFACIEIIVKGFPTMSAHHEEAHTGGKKSIPQILFWFVLVFAVPYFVVTSVISLGFSDSKSVPYPASHPEVTAKRIQKVGSVEMKAVDREPKTGAEVYAAQCSACHAAGVAGAPKFGDAGAWAARIKNGYEALLTSALKGKGAMGAQGGGAFNDFEIGRAVVHMANAAGGNLAEPKKPEAAK
jgi:cytochrome c5